VGEMKSIVNGELGDKIAIEGSESVPFLTFPDIETPVKITETGVVAESKSIFFSYLDRVFSQIFLQINMIVILIMM
jgi:hypothetical protein